MGEFVCGVLYFVGCFGVGVYFYVYVFVLDVLVGECVDCFGCG